MRIILFAAMQAAVLILVSIIGSILLNLFGIYIDGSSYTSLLLMCALFGCVGSVISLFMSKFMCKKAYGVRVITAPSNSREEFLLSTVASLAEQAGLKMPEVGIYNSPDPNAFATGASKDEALVAVSTGLLDSMSMSDVRGVLGHEISHIKNGDMVTMALLQGVLNTFVYFF
ncbi:MAG: M48 family metalloprotease, partial [Succinivibrio sp.]